VDIVNRGWLHGSPGTRRRTHTALSWQPVIRPSQTLCMDHGGNDFSKVFLYWRYHHDQYMNCGTLCFYGQSWRANTSNKFNFVLFSWHRPTGRLTWTDTWGKSTVWLASCNCSLSSMNWRLACVNISWWTVARKQMFGKVLNFHFDRNWQVLADILLRPICLSQDSVHATFLQFLFQDVSPSQHQGGLNISVWWRRGFGDKRRKILCVGLLHVVWSPYRL
jgi:hypothetical protein